MGRPVVWLDTETTSLNPDREVWEIAMICQATPDVTQFEMTIVVEDVDLTTADPESLKFNRFHERHAEIGGENRVHLPGHLVAMIVADWLKDKTIVAAQPHFDTVGLSTLLLRHGENPTPWHYRLRDVESIAEGHARRPLGGLQDIAAAFGIPSPPKAQHTAMGDAQLVRAIYQRCMDTTTHDVVPRNTVGLSTTEPWVCKTCGAPVTWNGPGLTGAWQHINA